MPVKVYKSEFTDKIFDSFEKAQQEELIAARAMIEEFFPRYHKTDDKYTSHCVDCGKLLYSHDQVWDGHRNQPGFKKVIVNAHKLLDGCRCEACHAKAIVKLARMINDTMVL